MMNTNANQGKTMASSLRKRKKGKIAQIILYALLILYAFATVYPFLWAVAGSFKPLKEIVAGDLSILPKEFTLGNYEYIFGRSSLFVRWLLNSVIVSVFGTIINLFMNTMAGYALARLQYPGRMKFYYAFLALMMVPTQVLLIPNYLILLNLNLLDTYGALILPAAINLGQIFMMRQFFLSFPKEVEEAASIDGLGRTQTFLRIVVPLAKPSISTQAVLLFMSFWNEFMKPMMYIKSPTMYTLTLGLQSFQSNNQGVRWDYTMAASVITIIPIVILFLVFNRYFMQGVRMDGEK